MPFVRRTPLVLGAVAAIALPYALHAQACYGTPSRGGLAFETGKVSFGTMTGASGAIAGRRVALSGSYRRVEVGEQVSGNGGHGRLALVLGSRRVQVCPALGVDFERRAWDAGAPGTLTSNQLRGLAGVGLGLEQPVYRDLMVIPFAVVQYAYTAVHYSLDAPNSDVQDVGDTTSAGDLEYGLLARYKILYGGFAARHAMKSAPPYLARWVVGLTFPAGPGARRREAVPARAGR